MGLLELLTELVHAARGPDGAHQGRHVDAEVEHQARTHDPPRTVHSEPDRGPHTARVRRRYGGGTKLLEGVSEAEGSRAKMVNRSRSCGQYWWHKSCQKSNT